MISCLRGAAPNPKLAISNHKQDLIVDSMIHQVHRHGVDSELLLSKQPSGVGGGQ
jgi:hypothetical protein